MQSGADMQAGWKKKQKKQKVVSAIVQTVLYAEII